MDDLKMPYHWPLILDADWLLWWKIGDLMQFELQVETREETVVDLLHSFCKTTIFLLSTILHSSQA